MARLLVALLLIAVIVGGGWYWYTSATQVQEGESGLRLPTVSSTREASSDVRLRIEGRNLILLASNKPLTGVAFQLKCQSHVEGITVNPQLLDAGWSAPIKNVYADSGQSVVELALLYISTEAFVANNPLTLATLQSQQAEPNCELTVDQSDVVTKDGQTFTLQLESR